MNENVFVESNFILELAFQQSECQACESILELAKKKKITLFIPSLALVEPFSTIYQQKRLRNDTRSMLDHRLSEVKGSNLAAYKKLDHQIPDWQKNLSLASDEATHSLQEVFFNVSKCSRIIEMRPEILEIDKNNKAYSPLKDDPIDSLIFSCILWQCGQSLLSHATFASKDKHFQQIKESDHFKGIIKGLGLKLNIFKSFQQTLQFLEKPNHK